MKKSNEQLVTVIELRDAAVALVEKQGVPDENTDRVRWCWLGRHGGKTPKARIAIFQFSLTKAHAVRVWASVKGRNIEVLNMVWSTKEMEVLTFRRGDWESELLAMTPTTSVTIH